MGKLLVLTAFAVAASASRAAAVEPDFDNVVLTPLTCGVDEPVGDESPSSLDFVGTEQYPAAQVGHDDDFLYFRYRVDRNATGPGGFDQWAWVALLQVPNGDPFQYQYAVGLTGDGVDDDFGNNNADSVEIWQNTIASDIDFSPVFHDTSEVRLFSQKYNFVSPDTANTGPLARVVLTGDGSDFGGDPDYFIDFAVPVPELIDHGVVGSADELDDVLYFPAVSTNMSNFNKGYLNGCPFLPNTDLEVGKTVTPEAAQAGTDSPVTYTITVRNAGLVLGKGLVIEDAGFPPFFALGSINVTADDPLAVPTVESTDPLVVKVPLLPREATVTVEVNGTASPTCDSDPFVNTAIAHASNAMDESASATLSVGAGAAESCDGVDNDCDGEIDEGGGALCDDANACTSDACVGGMCNNYPSDPNCRPCEDAGDCDDDNACTTDACSGGICESQQDDPNCRPCETSGDCDDNNGCTTDSCDGGICSSIAADPNCVPCHNDTQCNDGNGCTADSCQPDGTCAFVPGDPECVPCTTDGDCNDGNGCTADSCQPDGTCAFVPGDPECVPCTGDIDCSDGDGCTTDTCNAQGVCEHVQPDPTCVPCATAAECDDAQGCTDDTCNAQGVCEHADREGCVPCEVDTDCDSDACTAGTCLEDGSCQFNTIPGCIPCDEDADCPSDENECTEDSCFQGMCAYVPIPDCVVCVPEAEVCGDGEDNDCDDLTDCDDPNCAESPQCEVVEEICGNCIDDDGDSFVDLDDPDCCALSQSIPMKKLRIKTPVQIKRKRLKVKARYSPALPSENFDPLSQDTSFQMSDENGMVFCATLPASEWKLRNRKRTIFRYKNRFGVLSNGLSLGTYREKRKGQVIFRTRGKKVNLDIREFSGEVRATVRLGEQCSFATAELREGKNAIVFPIVTNP